MKLQVGTERPGHFQPGYPEQWDIVSHLECAAGIPQALFAITTRKENGQPNVCFHSWSCFHGDKTAFFAVLGGLFWFPLLFCPCLTAVVWSFLMEPVFRKYMPAPEEPDGPEEDVP